MIPNDDLIDFMRKKTGELFSEISNFSSEMVENLPDNPLLIDSAIDSVMCGAVASFLSLRYSKIPFKEKIHLIQEIFNCILKNFEELEDCREWKEFNKKILVQYEMDKD